VKYKLVGVPEKVAK
jgi:hypothetical protein